MHPVNLQIRDILKNLRNPLDLLKSPTWETSSHASTLHAAAQRSSKLRPLFIASTSPFSNVKIFFGCISLFYSPDPFFPKGLLRSSLFALTPISDRYLFPINIALLPLVPQLEKVQTLKSEQRLSQKAHYCPLVRLRDRMIVIGLESYLVTRSDHRKVELLEYYRIREPTCMHFSSSNRAAKPLLWVCRSSTGVDRPVNEGRRICSVLFWGKD